MFYVYHGYVSPDNYDSSEGPTYEISTFTSESAVLSFKEDFEEGLCEDSSNVIFRVFEGEERKVASKEVTTKYYLT